MPPHGSGEHLGVASCASATCHGSATPLDGGVVPQNEVTVWQTLDKHAQAYNLLFNEQSKRIARNLGLPDAHTAKICLDCHADNPPAERRGPQFQITDGVGCEACHGGSSNWIRVHTINDNANSHQRNISAGLYPTADPTTRARLCLSCHFGDETKFVTHRIMGAGHPRLSFELDTFTAIQPAHFVVDEDYRQRKPAPEGAQVWAVGQAMGLVQILDGILSPKWGRTGLFPELVFFDCHACHKPMSANRWQERASLGLGPGVVRFNDAHLIMLRVAAGVVSPPLAEKLRQQGRALHRASQAGPQQWTAAAKALRTTAREASDMFERHSFTQAELKQLLDALVREGARGEYTDYVAAEQTTMAMGSLLETLRAEGWISETEYSRAESVMNDLYAAVQKDEQYRPAAHMAALRRVQAAAR